MPTGSVEEQDGVGAPFDGAGDLVEVKLHGVGVGEGQRQGGARAAGGADRAEQVGALVALVGGLAGPRSASRPLPHETVLLPDPCLVPRVKPEGGLWNQISIGLWTATLAR